MQVRILIKVLYVSRSMTNISHISLQVAMSGDTEDSKNYQHMKYDWLKPDKVRYLEI